MRIFWSAVCDADPNVPTIVKTAGYIATTNIAAQMTAVINKIALAMVSPDIINFHWHFNINKAS